MTPNHALQALIAIAQREVIKFVHQRGRLLSALVRPALNLRTYGVGPRVGIVCAPVIEHEHVAAEIAHGVKRGADAILRLAHRGFGRHHRFHRQAGQELDVVRQRHGYWRHTLLRRE